MQLWITPGEGIGPDITAQVLHAAAIPHEVTALHIAGAIPPTMTCPTRCNNATVQYYPTTPVAALELAVHSIRQQQAQPQPVALVTGPIAKVSWRGNPHAGHTEILQDLANTYWPQQDPKSPPHQAAMAFTYQQFRLLLLTRHVPLACVPQVLAQQPLAPIMALGIQAFKAQRVAVLGVNPHACEMNLPEEHALLLPAIEQLRQQFPHCQISHPLAADGFFRGFSASAPSHDLVISPYHDQGLVAMKILGGYQAVNVTLGLPFVRTSVSHGTAFDLVKSGTASPEGLVAALETAVQLLL